MSILRDALAEAEQIFKINARRFAESEHIALSARYTQHATQLGGLLERLPRIEFVLADASDPRIASLEAEVAKYKKDAETVAPTAQCPNCGAVDEFSVSHCEPDDVGAVYPVITCHICDLIYSDQRAESARAAIDAELSKAKP